MVPVFKNIWERSIAKNYRPVSLLSVISKAFGKLVNNRLVDHLEKCGLFFRFAICFYVFFIEWLGILTSLELLELQHLIYPGF